MNKTSIEYLTHTWNPLAMRCTPVSEGCANCWHLTLANRLMNNPTLSPAQRNAYFPGGLPWLHTKEAREPVRRKRPAVIGVQFMGDLFHGDVGALNIGIVLNVIARCPQHTFLLLTKRPDRMCDALTTYYEMFRSGEPFPNVWPGVTVENQARADERIPILLDIPAAVRFVSIEPMLGPVDLGSYLSCWRPGMQVLDVDSILDWVIVGGETGPGARPMHPDWVRSVRDQCVEAGVPFFFKHWGEHCHPEEWPREKQAAWIHAVNKKTGESGPYLQYMENDPDWLPMPQVGKRTAGRLLDGREWNERPEGVA